MFPKLPAKLYVGVIIIIALPGLSFLTWYFQEKKPIDILIMNKSSVSANRVEHMAAFWVLNHERYIKRTGKTYRHKSDYYGFIPSGPAKNKEYFIKEIDEKKADSLATNYDAAWFVDTYGVQLEEWYAGNDGGPASSMLYGGLDHGDFLFIRKMLERNKLVIAEFNFFASPTTVNIRRRVEQLTGVYWSGWSGRYYDNLNYRTNGEFPDWIVEQYETETGSPWIYSGPGIIFINIDGSIVVLENEIHLDIEVPLVTTSKTNARKYGVSERVHYPGRFDISYAADTASVLSFYEIYATSLGEQILDNHNIPSRFPAVSTGTGEGVFYYFAGTYSHIDISPVTSRLAGIRSFGFLKKDGNIASKNKFFINYYYPLVSGIFKEYHSEITN